MTEPISWVEPSQQWESPNNPTAQKSLLADILEASQKTRTNFHGYFSQAYWITALCSNNIPWKLLCLYRLQSRSSIVLCKYLQHQSKWCARSSKAAYQWKLLIYHGNFINCLDCQSFPSILDAKRPQKKTTSLMAHCWHCWCYAFFSAHILGISL